MGKDYLKGLTDSLAGKVPIVADQAKGFVVPPEVLNILGESTAAVEPDDCVLNYPAFWTSLCISTSICIKSSLTS